MENGNISKNRPDSELQRENETRHTEVSLALVSFCGCVAMAALRINLSLAIVCMVNHTSTQTSTENLSQDANNVCHLQTASSPRIGGEFNWSKESQGIYLGAFFWGYLLTQLPGGWMAERFGAKRVIGSCMLMASLTALLIPVATRASPWLLVAIRVFQGMMQGVVIPSMHYMWSKWAPPLERSRLIGFTYAGAQFGNIVTLPLSGLLCHVGPDGGWASIFYFCGLAGLLWFVFWMFVAYDDPNKHPRITDAERIYISETNGYPHETGIVNKSFGKPWRRMVTSLPVWAMLIGLMSAEWGTYTLLTNIPTFMREVLKFDIKSSGIFSGTPYVAFWLCINLACYLADVMRSKGCRTSTVRKCMQTIGTIIPGILLIGMANVDCGHPHAAIVLLILGMGLSGFYYAGCVVNHVDIAPPLSGTLMGICNSASTLSGILAPYAVGVITKDQTQLQWKVVFFISAAICLVGTLFYVLCADGEIQDWVKPLITDQSPGRNEQNGVHVVLKNGTPERQDADVIKICEATKF